MHILIRISELQSDDVDLWTQSPIYIKSSGEPLKYSWRNSKHNLFVLTYPISSLHNYDKNLQISYKFMAYGNAVLRHSMP
jgi:hypothetical protein